RLKAAYMGERTNIAFADTYASVEARLGDRNVALKVYEEMLAIAPSEPQIKAHYEQLKAGVVPEPPINSSVEGAAKVFYLLGGARARPGEEILPLIYMQFAKFLAPRDNLIDYALGEGFGSVGQNERALGYFDAIAADSPFRPRAMIRKAFNLEAIGKTDEAIKTLNDLVAANKADLDALNSLGVLLRSKKRWPDAIAAYTKAIEEVGTPTAAHWSLFHGRGICYERNKQWPLAEADLKKALEFLPDNPRLGPLNAYNRAQVLNYLAYSWVDRGIHIDEAFPMLQRAVDLTEGRDGYIIDSLGWAYYRQNQFDNAVRELERALALKSSDPVINDHLGDAYWKVGRKLEAQFQWNHARDLKPEPEDLEQILKKIENGLQDNNPAAADAAPKPNGG
ncbi:MAG: tetratricopeptide repeat protein, partial [Beijerinckiaceae bacterium]|nr:tetratricopeptide repeat protein [Beijerinckiaceae bacterium]